jgi:anion-transporting  ArsA/GET3 family ATPase
MQDSQQRMIETQARQITNLNNQIIDLKKQANKYMEQLTKCQSQAAMYNLIEELVGEHPNLADNWSDFLMMLKMVEEGVEDRFKKLMVPDYVPYVLPEDKLK